MVRADISDLLNKTLVDIRISGSDSIYFTTDSGEVYLMWHQQDCCESVYLEDVHGDLDDLLNSPILMAEEETGGDAPKDSYDESYTWTFYKLATVHGYVTLRWYGSSNGYYSESVDFHLTNNS